MAKHELGYPVYFHRRATGANEIGPVTEHRTIRATSKTAAQRKAREVAKSCGWRFMGFYGEVVP